MSQGFRNVRSTGLEPVPVAGHAPQTCAYADSATTAEQWDYKSMNVFCQALTECKIPVSLDADHSERREDA